MTCGDVKVAIKPQQIQGIGLGLRAPHYSYIIENRPNIAWFEALTDNYLQSEPARKTLFNIRQFYPMTLHGVGLSLGSTDPLNEIYLKKLKQLAQELQPTWISEHLCWTSAQQHYTHQLLPLPYTKETIHYLVERIQRVQDYLGQQILIENVATYLDFTASTLTEWDFINSIAERADCYILLDLNNIYISAHNQNYAAKDYIQAIAKNRVKQFHLAGFEKHPHYLLDAHNAPVAEPVWNLYQMALHQFGAVPTLIEWDANIPPFEILLAQAHQAELLYQKCKM